MPGVIGNLFSPDQQADQIQTTDVSTENGTALDLSPEVTIEMGGTYQELDGSTTTWSNTTTVGLDVGAELDHATSSGFEDSVV